MIQNLNVARLHLDAAQAALDALAAELDEWDENRKAYEDVNVPDAIDAVCVPSASLASVRRLSL